MKKILTIFFTAIFVLSMAGIASAHHLHHYKHQHEALLTDGTGTNGAGEAVLDINYTLGVSGSVIDDHKNPGKFMQTEGKSVMEFVLSYGLTDALDIALISPPTDFGSYLDYGVELKWVFLSGDALNVALKPSITLPFTTAFYGNMLLLFTEKLGKGFSLNENLGVSTIGEIHISVSGNIGINDTLTAVLSTGTENTFNTIFLIGGIGIGVTKGVDLNLGLHADFTNEKSALYVMSGISLGL